MQQNVPTKKYNGPKLFVGCLSPTTTHQTLREYFEALCPIQVVKVEFSRKSKNKKGFGYIILDRQEDVNMILQMEHVIDHKRVLVVPYDLNATTNWYNHKAKSIKVLLRNVPDHVSELEISLMFEPYLRVLVVNLLKENSPYGCIENVAHLELLNPFTPVFIGDAVLSCDSSLTQTLDFPNSQCFNRSPRDTFSSSQLSRGSEKISPLQKVARSLLDFDGACQEDKHCKYEFIRTQGSLLESPAMNYRFNLKIPRAGYGGARLVTPQVITSKQLL